MSRAAAPTSRFRSPPRAAGHGHPRRALGPADEAGAAAALGVLALYDRLGADEFDDDDLATLRTFAGHAAVAVDNVRVHEEAQRLSLTDPLTGLWNYRYLRESIRREVERASRFGRMLSVLALDLDRFKDVNDTYGHAAGDTVLAEFARRVRGEIREVDLAFRQGGEEFVLLLPETDARGAAIVAERLGAAVRDTPIAVEAYAGPVLVTVSVGIAVYPGQRQHRAGGAGGRRRRALRGQGGGPRHVPGRRGTLGSADPGDTGARVCGEPTRRAAARRPAGAGQPGAGRARPVRPGGGRTGIVLPAHARPDPADDTPGSDAARAGPDAARPGPGGGASSGPHPPRQSRGR